MNQYNTTNKSINNQYNTVSKPDSVVYKKKRAQRTVESDEEESMQEAKRMRCGTLRLYFYSTF